MYVCARTRVFVYIHFPAAAMLNHICVPDVEVRCLCVCVYVCINICNVETFMYVHTSCIPLAFGQTYTYAYTHISCSVERGKLNVYALHDIANIRYIYISYVCSVERGKLKVYALQDVAEGQEMFHIYAALIGNKEKEKRVLALQKTWQFTCRCRVCMYVCVMYVCITQVPAV